MSNEQTDINKTIFINLNDYYKRDFIELDKMPSKVIVNIKNIDSFKRQQIYLARRLATAVVTLYGDGGLGKCICSACNKAIDAFDKYCRHCGAQLMNTKELLNERIHKRV